MKVTKGEWSVFVREDENTGNFVEIHAPFEGGDEAIAQVLFYEPKHELVSMEEAIANAHVMAAAKDLLEAAEYMLDTQDWGDSYSWDMLAIAVAKANGKAVTFSAEQREILDEFAQGKK